MTSYQRISRYFRRSRIRNRSRSYPSTGRSSDRRARRVHLSRVLRARPRQRVREEPHEQRAWPRPVGRDRAAVHPRGRRAAARIRPGRAHARAPRRGAPVAAPPLRAVRPRARRDDRRPGRADGQGRPEVDLPVRLAGRRRREPGRAHLPRPEPVPGQLGARARPAPEQRPAARRPDRARRGAERHVLARADRRRRGGRLRRAAERVRADEGDDRGGRRRRALRGPARLREEVRPPRRQGARPDRPVRPHARRRPARGRRLRRPDRPGRPHRRPLGDAPDERRRRDRRRVRHRRAHARGLLPDPRRARARRSPARSPTRRTPT